MSGVYTELLTALESVGELSGKSHEEIEEKFDEIAKILLTKTKIVKGTREYYITDIEFYLYCDGHEDIITYPRSCEAGEWFFHDSGVDISFGSNSSFKDGKAKIPDNNSFFGGILLRGISLIENKDSRNKGVNGTDLKDRPSNVFYELFRNFCAFSGVVEFPKLVKCELERDSIKIEKHKRKNLLSSYDTDTKIEAIINDTELFSELVEKKVKDILSYRYENISNKEDFFKYFKKYFDSCYRYMVK